MRYRIWICCCLFVVGGGGVVDVVDVVVDVAIISKIKYPDRIRNRCIIVLIYRLLKLTGYLIFEIIELRCVVTLLCCVEMLRC